MNENKGESCPGEIECGDPKSKFRGPLSRYEEQTTKEVCRSCKLRDTKPENVPAEIAAFYGSALDLDEIQEVGGRFDYPDGLSAVEWVSLRSLKRGRTRAEKLKQQRDSKKK